MPLGLGASWTRLAPFLFYDRQQRRTLRRRMAMQPLKYCLPGARKGLLIAVQLKSPVGAPFEGVELEGHLRWIDFPCELSRGLCSCTCPPQSGQPLLHNFSDAIAHWTRTTVELR